MTTTLSGPPPGYTPTRSWGLVAAARAGDASAFAALYARYAEQITRFLARRAGQNRSLVEDLTQETFLRAWRRIHTASGDRGRDVGAWLTTIARNLLIDHHRGGHGHYEHPVPELPETRNPAGSADTAASAEQQVLDQFDRDTAAATVRHALAALPAAQRHALRLHDLAPGCSLAETAAAMGRTVPAVSALRYRAMRTMRARLADQGLSTSRQCYQAGPLGEVTR